jgi:protein involved in ribonucleotide reduction
VSELEVLAGVAASPSQNFGRFALGSDIEVRAAVPLLGALSVSGELMWAKNLDRGLQPADPIARGRDLREAGY